MDIAAWLRGLGLEQYEAAFRANEIDAGVLPSLTAEDLRDLGVTLVGHRRRLLDAIAALGLDPWVIVVTILATTGLWLIPSQVPMYLATYSASEGRLFGPAQSRRAAFGYLAVLLVGLVVTLPYWHLLGLL